MHYRTAANFHSPSSTSRNVPHFAQVAIRKAYLRKAAAFHPDKHPNQQHQAGDVFSRISLAFKTLSDPVAREK